MSTWSKLMLMNTKDLVKHRARKCHLWNSKLDLWLHGPCQGSKSRKNSCTRIQQRLYIRFLLEKKLLGKNHEGKADSAVCQLEDHDQ